jgi:hypothetical protein
MVALSYMCALTKSVEHLFFNRLIAQLVWRTILEIFGVHVGANFLSVATWWISNNKNVILNIFPLWLFGLCGLQDISFAFRGKLGQEWT